MDAATSRLPWSSRLQFSGSILSHFLEFLCQILIKKLRLIKGHELQKTGSQFSFQFKFVIRIISQISRTTYCIALYAQFYLLHCILHYILLIHSVILLHFFWNCKLVLYQIGHVSYLWIKAQNEESNRKRTVSALSQNSSSKLLSDGRAWCQRCSQELFQTFPFITSCHSRCSSITTSSTWCNLPGCKLHTTLPVVATSGWGAWIVFLCFIELYAF